MIPKLYDPEGPMHGLNGSAVKADTPILVPAHEAGPTIEELVQAGRERVERQRRKRHLDAEHEHGDRLAAWDSLLKDLRPTLGGLTDELPADPPAWFTISANRLRLAVYPFGTLTRLLLFPQREPDGAWLLSGPAGQLRVAAQEHGRGLNENCDEWVSLSVVEQDQSLPVLCFLLYERQLALEVIVKTEPADK